MIDLIHNSQTITESDLGLSQKSKRLSNIKILPKVLQQYQSERLIQSSERGAAYQKVVRDRLKQREREKEIRHKAQTQYLVKMMPTASAMVRFMQLATPSIYDSGLNYKPVSKAWTSNERRRLDELTNGLLY